MTQKLTKSLLTLAGTACCPGQVTPSRKNRRLPGTVTGKPGVRHLAGTAFADTTSFKS